MSSLWLEESYLRQLSNKLVGFAQKDKHIWNCRCPYCGDSKKKKNKKRGYFYVRENTLFFQCKNCEVSVKFSTLLKKFDPSLFRNYRMDMFKEKRGGGAEETVVEEIEEKVVPKETSESPNIFDELDEIIDLDETHEAFRYALKRKLPMETREMFLAENFVNWTQGHTDKFEKWSGDDHPRIIFPFRARDGHIIGYTARALHGEEPKYYRIFTDDEEKERFFGIDRIDESKQVYVFEGELDSMFIHNAIAVSNGKLDVYFNKDAIYVPDANPRNIHIVKGIGKLVERGLKVCFLPTNIEGKDINEYIMNGLTEKQIMKIIHDNTYQGLKAKLFFGSWRKC